MFSLGLINSILTYIEIRCGRIYYPESCRFGKLPEVASITVPRPSPQHLVLLLTAIPIPTPFQNIACHVIQTTSIRLRTFYWGSGFLLLNLCRQFLQSWHNPVLFFLFHYSLTGTPCFSSLPERPIPILSLLVIFSPPI